MRYKLICFDMDGVIFKDVNFWMTMHKRYGTLAEGEHLTRRYLNSDYKRLVDEVVSKLWRGKDAKPYFEIIDSLEYNDGVRQTFDFLRTKKVKTAIISASSIDAARRVQREHGVDYVFANELVVKNGKITGEFLWPVGAGKENKADLLKRLCSSLGIRLSDVAYIGDSDTDIEAFKIAGLSIAFNSSSNELRRYAKEVVRGNNLADILKKLG